MDKDRLGRCYELAGRRVLEDQAGDVLVHGTIHREPSPPLRHAWVILDNGNLWEPVTEMELPPDAFTRFFGATPEHRYPAVEAIARMLETGHFGPWED